MCNTRRASKSAVRTEAIESSNQYCIHDSYHVRILRRTQCMSILFIITFTHKFHRLDSALSPEMPSLPPMHQSVELGASQLFVPVCVSLFLSSLLEPSSLSLS